MFVPMFIPVLLTKRQAAAYLGLSVKTFEAVCNVKPVVVNGTKKWNRRWLDEWADSRHVSTPPDSADFWIERFRKSVTGGSRKCDIEG